MQLISRSIPILWIRTHLLGSASASVALDARQQTSSSLVKAMQAIGNAERTLASQLAKGDVTDERLHIRASKLGDLRCQLYNERTPMTRTWAMEHVLTHVRNLQPFGSASATRLEACCHAGRVLARSRDALDRAFWAGALNDAARFDQQVAQLALLERSQRPADYPQEQILQEILDRLQRPVQGGRRDFNPQAAILATFQTRLRTAASSPAGASALR